MIVHPRMAHSHGGIVVGIGLVCAGLLHLVLRRYYARRNEAVESGRRETAITPFRRHWLWPTSESGNLVWITAISAAMVIAVVVFIVLAL